MGPGNVKRKDELPADPCWEGALIHRPSSGSSWCWALAPVPPKTTAKGPPAAGSSYSAGLGSRPLLTVLRPTSSNCHQAPRTQQKEGAGWDQLQHASPQGEARGQGQAQPGKPGCRGSWVGRSTLSKGLAHPEESVPDLLPKKLPGAISKASCVHAVLVMMVSRMAEVAVLS